MYMVMFGVVQIVMSFIPDLHNMEWVSVVAAIMSFTYSFIGLGLGIATVISMIHLQSTIDSLMFLFLIQIVFFLSFLISSLLLTRTTLIYSSVYVGVTGISSA